MPKKQKSFFEKRSVIASFGILALIGAGFFTQTLGRPTANAINTEGTSVFSLLPIIGILLLICSIVLIAYSVVKKD